ncbi:hypothetical protein [Mesoaciditoga lauensis]|uniref:hypothetical protein n=1 Tax=Mesoaciditoga lauensis TaxID=1495039 RepID=UPI0012DFEE37|nr:hypothetical protein [Mesoaciditoga lauensis]
MKRKRTYFIYILLAGFIAWLLYFDVVSYMNFKVENLKYRQALKEYEKAKNDLNMLEKELKELQKQIESSGNNISQTNSSTGTSSSENSK